MNYLAHAFLSFGDSQIQVGNLMGDFVKGKQYENYPDKIRQGILLHRKIDSFTDRHPIIAETKKIFKPSYRFSGAVFVDILFDHFLANDERYFGPASLQHFTKSVYNNLLEQQYLFNEAMKQLFYYMSTYDWLYNYKHKEGLYKSIQGICKRHPVLGEPSDALQLIETNYASLESLYQQFFPELMEHIHT